MSTTEEKTKRTGRRPPARQRDVILGCIDERIIVLRGGPFPTRPSLEGEMADAALFCENAANRFNELIDELRRSLKGGKVEEDE